MAGAATDLTGVTFDEVIAGSDVPVVVEFWAEWCPPCRVLAPVLDEIAAEHEGRLLLHKVDSDGQPELVARFAVGSVPTTLVFVRGALAKRMAGARGKRQLLEELADLVS
jgi:thioredoxin 1